MNPSRLVPWNASWMHVPGIVAECTLIVARATFLGILLDAYLHPFLHTWYEEISYTFLERCHLCEGEPRKRFQKIILGGSRRKTILGGFPWYIARLIHEYLPRCILAERLLGMQLQMPVCNDFWPVDIYCSIIQLNSAKICSYKCP